MYACIYIMLHTYIQYHLLYIEMDIDIYRYIPNHNIIGECYFLVHR